MSATNKRASKADPHQPSAYSRIQLRTIQDGPPLSMRSKAASTRRSAQRSAALTGALESLTIGRAPAVKKPVRAQATTSAHRSAAKPPPSIADFDIDTAELSYDQETIRVQFPAPPQINGSAQPTVAVVPSLFELCTMHLANYYEHLIHYCQILPTGTLRLAIQCVIKHNLLSDSHLALVFRTLPALQSEQYLHHRCWFSLDDTFGKLSRNVLVQQCKVLQEMQWKDDDLLCIDHSDEDSAQQAAYGLKLDLHAQHQLTATGLQRLVQYLDYCAKNADEQQAEVKTSTSSALDQLMLNHSHKLSHDAVPTSNPSQPPNIDHICRTINGSIRQVNITWMDLSYCSAVNDKIFISLTRHTPHLRRLDVSGCRLLTSRGFQCLYMHCTHLTVLRAEIVSIDDLAIQSLVDRLKHVTALSIGGCVSLSNISFQLIACNGQHLQHFSAAGCTQFTDVDAQDLAWCTSLHSLSLRSNYRLTDAGLNQLTTLAKRKVKEQKAALQSIDIGGCTRITDAAFRAFVAAHNQLIHIDVRGLTLLTDAAIDSIQAHLLRSITILNVQCCTGISDERLISLREALPDLHVLR